MRPISFSTFYWLLAFAACVTADVISVGRCPEVKILDTFDLTQFLGVWYEQSSYPAIGSFALKCINSNFWTDMENNVHVHYKALIKLLNNEWDVNGTVRALAPGQLDFSFNKYAQPAKEPNILVLGTDYRHYAVLFTCTGFTKMFHSSGVSILTREREAKRDHVIEARKVLEANNISASHLRDTQQVDCV